MRALALLGPLLLVACTTAGGGNGDEPPPTLPVTVEGVQVEVILPGTSATVTGSGFLSDALIDARVVGTVAGRDVELPLSVERVNDLALRVVFEAADVERVGAGDLTGEIIVDVRLGEAAGQDRAPIRARIEPGLTPVVEPLLSGVFPASPVVVRGADFIGGDEGRTLVALRGDFVSESGERKSLDVVDVVAEPVTATGWQRDAIQFTFSPTWVGIEPGHFEGEIRVDNVGATGWRQASAAVSATLDLLPPVVEEVSPLAASRGQAVFIHGQGFLGGVEGGLTTFRLEGEFRTRDGLGAATPPGGVLVSPTWRSGTELVFSLDPPYEFDCSSQALGAVPGTLIGTATPEITFGNQVVVGDPTPLEFEILPTRQVVFLRFLPAFTDSLRLFGLRNVSGPVKDRVVEVIERDYAGVNLEVRLLPPDDFLEFATVEIGGPDPNAQQLFGLDNTTGLDRCNLRLDDNLAGQNADSNGAYGGIFVESFLQLSPRAGDNPLADPAFDAIFDPVIARPVDADEYPGGARDDEIGRAIRTLGNLVGNTATHEIGHSLGLPVAPGCGQYHNAPGDRQIMDCGADRPFAERAELEDGMEAVFTRENRAYLERILPLR